MQTTVLVQSTRPMFRACPVNANSSGFTTKSAASVTRPTGNFVVPLVPDGPSFTIPSRVRIWPIGLGSNDDAFSIRIWSWTRIGSGPSPGILWVPSELGEYSCTLGNFTGVAGSPVLNTEFFADTITVVSEPTTVANTTNAGTTEVFSPANDTPAWIELRLRGVELLEFDFDQTTNTPTMNALLEFLNGPM